MTTNQILYDHIQNLEKELVKFGDHPIYNAINLKHLTKNLKDFKTLHDWFNSKNVTNHLRKNITKAILTTNPPEETKIELLSFLL
jgi:hypothetical protein